MNKKNFRLEPKQTETRSVSRLFRLFRETKKNKFSVCFGVSNLYRNNRNKQNCFETNRNNPEYSEKSITYLPRVLCLSYSCHIPVIFLSSCRPVIAAERWAILDVLIIKQTKEDETEGLEREGLERERLEMGKLRRDGVNTVDLSLFKPNLININVHNATCSCSVELY